MSEDRDLERRLDDAFATTRPRRGFEDELWARLARRQPWWRRAARWNLMPAMGTIAAVVVVGLVFVFTHSGGAGSPGRSTSTASGRAQSDSAGPAAAPRVAGALPVPGALSVPPESKTPAGAAGALAYYGPANLTWAGNLPVLPPVVPVYSYPTPTAADTARFTHDLQAVAQPSPAPPGAYAGADFSLRILPPQPGREPMFALTPSAPSGTADAFLAQHGLRPDWPNQRVLDPVAGKLQFRREFDIPGYGQAGQVDQRGEPAGLEAQLGPNGAALVVTGPMPLSVSVQWTPVRNGQGVLADATAASTAGAPKVTLTQAQVVFIAVAAGDHGFFEPAYLLTGTFDLNGQTREMRLLVAAV
jgi:hypothetical protein